MLDPASDFVPLPWSPTISSISSSDLESASTGSFFHDRSTTLGMLMEVTFPTSFTFNAPPPPSQRRRERNNADGGAAEDEMDDDEDDQRCRRLSKRRQMWWWGLCHDDVCGGRGIIVDDSKRWNSASLAEFLEVERRFGEELYGGSDQLEEFASATRVLFEEGRVLPPAENCEMHDDISNGVGAFRFRASMGGLCNRGVG